MGQLGLGDKPTVGHVGRFALQKNHRFLLEIFRALVAMEPSAHLVLVGEGELLDETLELVDKLGLEERVHYLGVRQDIPALMNAFDVLLLPSSLRACLWWGWRRRRRGCRWSPPRG